MKPINFNYTKPYILFKIVCFALTLLIAVFITLMSSMTGSQSGGESGGIIYNLLYGFINTFHIEIDIITFERIFNTIHSIMRKVMHIMEYAMLTLALIYSFEHIKYAITLSGIVAVIYAGADEIHQVFVPGRVGVYTDVLIDCIGIFVVLCVMFFLARYVYVINDKALYIRFNGLMVK